MLVTKIYPVYRRAGSWGRLGNKLAECFRISSLSVVT